MYGKIMIECDMKVLTGLHIGGSDAFSAIGATDSPVVKDPLTGMPIVPGSSLKGKIRTLLARSLSGGNPDSSPAGDDERICRLFGAINPIIVSRLQFVDCFVSNKNVMDRVGVTEVKAENVIDRANGTAIPRFIERVSAGTVFAVRIVYDISKKEELEADMQLLAKGMKLLQLDYLGGHGTRGNGRVSFSNFKLIPYEATNLEMDKLTSLFQEVADYELFPV